MTLQQPLSQGTRVLSLASLLLLGTVVVLGALGTRAWSQGCHMEDFIWGYDCVVLLWLLAPTLARSYLYQQADEVSLVLRGTEVLLFSGWLTHSRGDP